MARNINHWFRLVRVRIFGTENHWNGGNTPVLVLIGPTVQILGYQALIGMALEFIGLFLTKLGRLRILLFGFVGIGSFGSGKSSFANNLLEQFIRLVGAGKGSRGPTSGPSAQAARW